MKKIVIAMMILCSISLNIFADSSEYKVDQEAPLEIKKQVCQQVKSRIKDENNKSLEEATCLNSFSFTISEVFEAYVTVEMIGTVIEDESTTCRVDVLTDILEIPQPIKVSCE